MTDKAVKKWQRDQLMAQLLANEAAITSILRVLATKPDLAQAALQILQDSSKNISADFPGARERIDVYVGLLSGKPLRSN